MTSTLRILGAWTALTLAVAAQNDTVPSQQNGIEGGSGSAIPFGLTGPARVQYIYDVEDLPFAGPRQVTRVSIRADNPDNATAFAQKGFLFVSLLLSTTNARAESASSTFADNYGTDATLVIDNMPIMLPAQPIVTGPRPANIDFVLPTPWFYSLTPTRDDRRPMPTSLLVEIRVHSQPPGVYRIDNIGNCAIPPVQFGQLGPACHATGVPPLQLTPGNSMVAGSNYSWQIANAEPLAPLILFMGIAPQVLLVDNPALPLPVPLFDPANPGQLLPALAALLPTLAYSAPDCWINVSPTGMLIGAADTHGAATMTIALTASRSFIGMAVHAQAIARSQTANAMQVVTSAGQTSTVCGPLGVGRIYALGDVAAANGQWSFGQGAVIELH